jgi:hypothetical protein
MSTVSNLKEKNKESGLAVAGKSREPNIARYQVNIHLIGQ